MSSPVVSPRLPPRDATGEGKETTGAKSNRGGLVRVWLDRGLGEGTGPGQRRPSSYAHSWTQRRTKRMTMQLPPVRSACGFRVNGTVLLVRPSLNAALRNPPSGRLRCRAPQASGGGAAVKTKRRPRDRNAGRSSALKSRFIGSPRLCRAAHTHSRVPASRLHRSNGSLSNFIAASGRLKHRTQARREQGPGGGRRSRARSLGRLRAVHQLRHGLCLVPRTHVCVHTSRIPFCARDRRPDLDDAVHDGS